MHVPSTLVKYCETGWVSVRASAVFSTSKIIFALSTDIFPSHYSIGVLADEVSSTEVAGVLMPSGGTS